MKRERGFTYLGLLLSIAIVGLGLTLASEVWVNVARRQKLEQLEFVGQQFVQAIGSYYESTPGPVKRYPTTLQDLLDDRRNAFVRRHLRQVYVNPFTGLSDWEAVVAPAGGIQGVRTTLPMANGVSSASAEFKYSSAR